MRGPTDGAMDGASDKEYCLACGKVSVDRLAVFDSSDHLISSSSDRLA